MTDSTASVACSQQKSEPSLISPTTNASHNHHGHLIKEGGKTNAKSSKSYTVEENSELCNGCLHVEADCAFSESSVHNQNVLKCTHFDDVSCVHSSVCHSQSVSKTKSKCFEKVNGLAHAVAEHSSGDNPFVVNLLNTCKVEADEIESHSCNGDSSQGPVCMHRFRQADLVSSDDIGVAKVKDCSPEVHSDDLDALAAKLDKSLSHHTSNSNELLTSEDVISRVTYVVYESEKQMPDIMRLITKDLSEPYSIYTYRYFIHNWPKLCFLATADNKCVGAIVCKLDLHKKMVRRGYIAMLAVDSEYRRRQIGSTLVTKAIEAMISDDCDEVVLETEITNQSALRLYENLGFVRDKRLFRYYLNGVDALRLKLWLR